MPAASRDDVPWRFPDVWEPVVLGVLDPDTWGGDGADDPWSEGGVVND